MGAHPLILRANSPAKWIYLCLPLDLSEFNCEHIELWICPSLTVDFICDMMKGIRDNRSEIQALQAVQAIQAIIK